MENKKIVYMVQLDWSSDDDNGILTYLFDTKEKALTKFNEILKEERELDWYWSKDAFDENSKLDEENYELDTNIDDSNAEELYWNLKCIGNYYLHDFLELQIKEVL